MRMNFLMSSLYVAFFMNSLSFSILLQTFFYEFLLFLNSTKKFSGEFPFCCIFFMNSTAKISTKKSPFCCRRLPFFFYEFPFFFYCKLFFDEFPFMFCILFMDLLCNSTANISHRFPCCRLLLSFLTLKWSLFLCRWRFLQRELYYHHKL